MLDSAHPCGASLDPHSKASVRNTAVAAQVEVPLKRFLGKLVQSDLLLQKLEGRGAFSTADNLAITFRREYVNSECKLRTLRIARHVKRLHRRRIMMHHYRLFKLAGNVR